MTDTSSRTPANKPDLSLEKPCALVQPKVQEWCQMGGEDCLSRMGEPRVNDAIRNVDIMKQAKDNQDTRPLFRPDMRFLSKLNTRDVLTCATQDSPKS